MHAIVPLRKGGLPAGPDVAQYVVTPRGNPGQEIQELNDYLRHDHNGGVISLVGGGLYTLRRSMIVDAGSGVSLQGNGARIDARGVSNAAPVITMASRAPVQSQVSGFDGNTSNYWQARAETGGFVLLAPDGGTAIDINMDPAAATRNVRAHLRNLVLQGGAYGIRHRNFAYLCFVENFSIYGQSVACISMEGGNDKGENTGFRNGACFNAPLGLRVDTVPETGSAVGTYFNLDGVSFDYLGQHIQFVSGYGAARFTNCHFEWNSTNSTYPVDLATAANNRMIWDFQGCNFTHTGATENFPALFAVGNNHAVRVAEAFMHDVTGAGVSGKTMVANVTGSGGFEMQGTKSLTSTTLARHSSNQVERNWMADGGFDQSGLVDAWYANGDGNFSAPTRAASGGDVTAGCLSVPIVNGASVTRNLGLVVPVRGRRFSVSLMAKLTGGSGSVALKWAPCVIRGAITPGTKPTFSYEAPTTQIDSKTLNTSTYVEVGLTGNVPRLELPDWATHVKLIIDGFNLNAAAANLLLDGVRLDTW